MNAPDFPVSIDDHLAHIDHAFDLMALLDAGGQVLRVNAAAFDILGYAPCEMRGRHVREFVHPDDRAALEAIGLALRDVAACREQELRYLHRDGHVVYLAMSGRWSPDGQVLYATARDVTAHRLAREELAQSRARMNAMLESIGDAFFAVDRDWRVIYANRKAAHFVGVELGAGLGRPLLDVVPALEGTPLLERYRHAMATGLSFVVEAWWAPLATWIEVRAYPTVDGLSVYFHDISEQRQAAEAMRRSEQRFRILFQQAGDSILIVDGTLRVVAVNGRACANFGYAEHEFIGLPVSAIDSGFAYRPGLLDSLRRGETRLLRVVKRRKDGSTFPAEVHVSLFEDGGQEYFQAIVRDLTEREAAERQLRESERRFRELIEMTPSGYVRAGAGGVLLDANPSLCRLSGRTREALIGLPLVELFERLPWDGLEADGDGNTTVRGVEAVLRRADGEPLHVLFNGNVRRDDAGEPLLVTGLMIDISARKRAEDRLQQLATHDTLTGLPNRALLQDSVQRIMDAGAPAGGEGTELAVMFLDLDRFKEVNDSFGHELGDVLLCEVAARLRAVLGADDVIARLGGDEFVVAARCGRERAGALAARLLETLTAPVRVGSQDVIIGASIGIAMYPHDAGTRELLFQAADTAMYRAKSAGRNRLCFFERGMTVATQARMALELALRPALARGEFELHYQPRVDLRTMAVVGLEALLRWNHPRMGRVAPGEFIGIAEETGLIVPIGRWVLGEACRQTRRLVQEHGREVRVSVNVSARQLAQPGFVEDVRAELAASGLAPHCLELELTESALIEDMDRTAAMLGELQGLGVKVAVDDFGTGYSGLAYLRRFPIDVLKLDRSFVLQDDGRISAFDFVKAFVDMAHALRMSVVAEGVETAEVLDFLRAADCDEAQGYLLAQPMPLADVHALLARR